MYDDSSFAREQQYTASSPVIINAQPVPAGVSPEYVGTFAAPPATTTTAFNAQPYSPQGQQSYYVQTSSVSVQQINASLPRQRPQNRWADHICDWPSNLYPSCYCTWCVCCGMWLVAQMAQKTGCSSFQSIFWGWFACVVAGIILALVFGTGGFLYYVPMIYVFIAGIALRVHLARRDNINEHGGCFGECCVAFWCWSCSVAQMARHLYGYTKVLDGDGDPDRPDQYPQPPMQV